MSKDLRSFLEEVVRERPGDLREVTAPAHPRFEITAYGARIASMGEHPALLFSDVVGSELTCVTNVTATHERMALALGRDVGELVTGRTDLGAGATAHPPTEVTRDEAPVKQVVWTGPDVDLAKLPIPVHNELDGGPYITAGVGIMRDPESGRINAGIYRHHIFDSKRLGVWFFGSHHGGTIHRRYQAMGQDAPIALAVGHHPAFLMGAVSRVQGIGGEYEAAGAFLREPVEVVRAETSDLLVPAAAEVVIEGRIVCGEQLEEGPFAEWPGHYVGGGPKPFIEVDCITMRHNAIWQDIQASGQEHRLMGALPRISSVHRQVSQVVPGLRAVNIPLHARMHCYLSIHKEHDSDPMRAAFAALNTEPENLRMIVVVDDDIDPYDHQEMEWAVGTRFDAERDLQVVPRWNGPGGLLPSTWEYDSVGGRTARRSSAVIIDATKPAPPVVYPPRARVPAEAQARADLDSVVEVQQGGRRPWER